MDTRDAARLRSAANVRPGIARVEAYVRHSVRKRSWWTHEGLEHVSETRERGVALRGEHEDGTGRFLSGSSLETRDLERWARTRFATVGAWPEVPPPEPGVLRWEPAGGEPEATEVERLLSDLDRRGFIDVEIESDRAIRSDSWCWDGFEAEREAVLSAAWLTAVHPILGDWVSEIQNAPIERFPERIEIWHDAIPDVWVAPPHHWPSMGFDPVHRAGPGTLWVDPRGVLGVGFDDVGRPVPAPAPAGRDSPSMIWIRGAFDEPPAQACVGFRLDATEGSTPAPAEDFLVDRVHGMGPVARVGGWVRESGVRIAWAETSVARPISGRFVGTEGPIRHGKFGWRAPRAVVDRASSGP